MTALVTRTFSSLNSRNYRLYFIGQIVSMGGTWMQALAQSWLVLELTDSGTMLGLTLALQFAPFLVVGPWGGLLADRLDKRRLIITMQVTAAALALALAIVTATGVVTIWMVMALTTAFGFTVAIDNPTRQSFMHEMVGADGVPNAVALNSVVANAARVIGPGLGGLVIAWIGIAPCFFINAATYVAVVTALLMMSPDELDRQHGDRTKVRMLEGLRYVRRTRELRVPLIILAVAGGLGYQFPIVLPVLARYTFGGDAGLLGTMTALMGAGAVVGGLGAASRKAPDTTSLIRAAFVFGAVLLAVAAAPRLEVALAALVLTGTSSLMFIATSNAAVQLRAAPEMRGRVMGLWGVALLGTTPIGGPIVGWIAETFGARWALATGGIATIAVAIYATRALGVRAIKRAIPTGTAHAAAELAAAKDSVGVITIPASWRMTRPSRPRRIRAGGGRPRDGPTARGLTTAGRST
jgi:MFS family permease